MKILKILLAIILICHFSIITIGQLYDLNILKYKYFKYVNEYYINPFFEQNWSMFSPNPPQGNQYIILKYHTSNNHVLYIDIHEQILKGSMYGLFNINQRILKYQSECYNVSVQDILNKKTKDSNAINSLINYSKITLNKQKKFISKIDDNDIIKVDFYFYDETLCEFRNREKAKICDNKYILFPNIILGRKKDYGL